MKIKIQKAIVRDLNEIDEIYVQGVIDEIKLQFPKRSKSSIIKELNKFKKERLKGFGRGIKSKKQYWIIVKNENEIIGFASAEIKNKKEGVLSMLYIKKEFRKKGIGTKMTRERINWLKKKAVKKISAGMFIKNKASKINLEKFGFKPISIKMEKKIK
jgi:RimJ/RimL family protein N-acetyltransferase